jgi:hypothetical protein
MYNILALTTRLCGSWNWTVEAKEKVRITATEIKFMIAA